MTASRFRGFIERFDALLAGSPDEAMILRDGGGLLAALVSQDDWLPDAYARPDPERYAQYRLHLDAEGRYSVVSFVWGPGQSTPVHDHRVWGLVGVLRGAELSRPYRLEGAALVEAGQVHRLKPGEVEAISPSAGDIHQVSNALADQVSVSIHVYGADIGEVRRSTFSPEGGRKSFVSGYVAVAPPAWAG